MQKASETCRVLLQLLINILTICITLVLYIYILTYDARKLKHKCNISKKFKEKFGRDNRFSVNKKLLYIYSTSACRFTPVGLYPSKAMHRGIFSTER